MKILVLDGIGSWNRTSGIIDHAVDRLKEKLGCDAKWVNWKAAMAGVGGAGSWEQNSRDGVALLVSEFADTTDDFVLLAYSGGNRVVHEFLHECPHFRDRVKAVGLMSDPWRPRDRWQAGTAKPIGYGIMGEDYGPIPHKTLWTAVHDDVITAAWPDALMRLAADLSGGDPDEMVTTAINLAQKGTWQLSWQLGIIQRNPFGWFIGLPGRVGQLGSDAAGYLSGRHTSAYTQPYRTGDDERSLAVRLADSLAWMVNNPKK